MREIDAIRRELRRAGLMRAPGETPGGDGDYQERYDAREVGHADPEEAATQRDLLRGGEGFSWALWDAYREDLDQRAGAERAQREAELQRRAADYPLDNDTWWEDLRAARRRPDLRRVVRKSIDFGDDEREAMRWLVGLTRAEWDAVAGRRSRTARTHAERERYAELGRRVDAAVAAQGAGGVKLLCEAYGTSRRTVSRLRYAARSVTRNC